jgi:hypothetical protein
MRVLALIAGLMSAMAMGFALWDRNLSLAAANFSTIVWTILYAFKD